MPKGTEYTTEISDMNDRALRNIVVGIGGPTYGVPREDHYLITVASEIMAIFCLASDLEDLKARTGRMPTNSEVADVLGIDADKVAEILGEAPKSPFLKDLIRQAPSLYTV